MKVIYKGKLFEVKGKKRVKELLREFGESDLTCLVIDLKRKRLLTPDVLLREDWEIELKKVTSGG